ncbi:hypothetical protein [Marinoscillum furvescens]|uniref:Uncharacterized protein n=1 Tax=Marinoscillum furvescens DSM 4134 TaxID=1122208 RepID=A0A3D9L6G1_MARFU|nr:hypothetical protein [Marinoscillum furvescens]REE00548.1 hypothetical protein C7460_105174 [Marinoscillum furvescens DSM 4134]
MTAKSVFAIICTLFSILASAQNDGVGIGTTSISSDAILEVKSNNKGLLIPRLSTTAINAMDAKSEGLMVFNNTTNLFQYWNGDKWLHFLAVDDTGPLTLNNIQIAGVANGNQAQDAINKRQLDTEINDLYDSLASIICATLKATTSATIHSKDYRSTNIGRQATTSTGDIQVQLSGAVNGLSYSWSASTSASDISVLILDGHSPKPRVRISSDSEIVNGRKITVNLEATIQCLLCDEQYELTATGSIIFEDEQ